MFAHLCKRQITFPKYVFVIVTRTKKNTIHDPYIEFSPHCSRSDDDGDDGNDNMMRSIYSRCIWNEHYKRSLTINSKNKFRTNKYRYKPHLSIGKKGVLFTFEFFSVRSTFIF